MAEPIVVTDDTFETEVVNSPIPVLVDFWATWCMPCLMVAPILEKIASEHEGQMKVARLDVDHNPQIASQHGIMSIPTLMLFKNGEVVERLVGAMPKQRLMEKIAPHLG
jgi:thioredoxin 1